MKTVREVCKIIGVTRKTLRGYDEIGLLCPTKKSEAGNKAWLYDDKAVLALMGIQAFSEAGYERKEIKAMLQEPTTSFEEHLTKAIAELEARKRRIEGMIRYFRMLKSVHQFQNEEEPEIATDLISLMLRGSSFMDVYDTFIDELADDSEWNEDGVSAAFAAMAAFGEIGKLCDELPESEPVQACAAKACRELFRLYSVFSKDDEELTEAERAAFGLAYWEHLKNEPEARAMTGGRNFFEMSDHIAKALRVYGERHCRSASEFEMILQDFLD